MPMLELSEALRDHARKERLSRLYDNDKLPFRSQPVEFRCKCGAKAEYVEPFLYKNQLFGGNWLLVEAIDMDDGQSPICRKCFCREYYVLHPSSDWGGGTPYSAIPSSERSYNGDAFNKGEW